MSFNALPVENILKAPITNGDAGVILKRDGTYQVFSTDVTEVNVNDPEIIAQGNKLLAISILLQMPDLMDQLLALAEEAGAAPLADMTVN